MESGNESKRDLMDSKASWIELGLLDTPGLGANVK